MELRRAEITVIPHRYAAGACEIRLGGTHLLCMAGVSEATPRWLSKPGFGWVTAEYSMLPLSGDSRLHREKAFKGGRAQEISRLIGRSLRPVIPLNSFGERQVHIDCDVLQADGGTRAAAVTGGFVALILALRHLHKKNLIPKIPPIRQVAAVSVGLVKGEILLDLSASEDKQCETDMNFVMTAEGEFIEIQGTAEQKPFSSGDLLKMTGAAKKGCFELFEKQSSALS